MINKANLELKENNEQLIAEKGIANGIKKRRLMLQEMSGFEISGNVHLRPKYQKIVYGFEGSKMNGEKWSMVPFG